MESVVGVNSLSGLINIRCFGIVFHSRGLEEVILAAREEDSHRGIGRYAERCERDHYLHVEVVVTLCGSVYNVRFFSDAVTSGLLDYRGRPFTLVISKVHQLVACIDTGTAQRVAGGTGVLCTFRLEASSAAPFPFLTMQLPSGRKLFYARPGRTEDGRITYWEQESGSWKQAETYGGKLTENLTQACGRDVLAFALRNLRAAGYSVAFHVHDEVVIDLPPAEDPQRALADVIEIMRRVPPWAEGLPLNADGWTGQFFTKD